MNISQIIEQVNAFLNPLGYSAEIDQLIDTILIEPNTNKIGSNRKDFFDGLMLNYFIKEKIFEVAEYKAGPAANELHIYKETQSLKIALKELIKGNKRKPIKIWS